MKKINGRSDFVRCGMLIGGIISSIFAGVYVLMGVSFIVMNADWLSVGAFLSALGLALVVLAGMFFVLAKSPKNRECIFGKDDALSKTQFVVWCVVLMCMIIMITALAFVPSNTTVPGGSSQKPVNVVQTKPLSYVYVIIAVAIVAWPVLCWSMKFIGRLKFKKAERKTRFEEESGHELTLSVDVGLEIGDDDEAYIDNMDGIGFEYFCAELLKKNGFKDVQVTKGSGDQGVDILAIKDDIKYAVQCKNYASTLGNTSIQEVYAGKSYYNCHVGVVMTNSYFTPGAKDLAKATGVLLWDRITVLNMIDNC